MRNGKRGRIHAGVQAGSGAGGGIGPEPGGSGAEAHRAGRLKEVGGKAGVTAEQMEISRLRAELARVKMERDILGKATA